MVKKSKPSSDQRPVYRLKNIKRRYQTGQVEVQALRGIDLLIDPGEFVALVGSSGSGKSTLMHVLGLLDRPDDGRLYLQGKEVSALSEGQRARLRRDKIGFVFQTFHLLPRLTALENVELPLIYSHVSYSQRLDRARKNLALVGLSDRVDHLPTELSGGQQQRVAIARALINNPSVVLADEPTGNLDSGSGKEIMAIFKKLNHRGRTIVLVTHDLEIAQSAQRLVTIKDGLITKDKKNVA
ncbi:MAG: ABC transporter ATP-binding protein [Patescibacteria group bacterium]|jgi:putative ABC transport system ATP-binding protein